MLDVQLTVVYVWQEPTSRAISYMLDVQLTVVYVQLTTANCGVCLAGTNQQSY